MASPVPPPQPGVPPTPQQIAAMQQQLAAEAAKHNMSVEQYVAQLKAQAMQQHQMQQQQRAAAAGQGQPQQVPIKPGPPDPKALAVAKWLRSQDLKSRTCILQAARKDMFKVKRAIRALQSPEYAKAASKNPLLPKVTDRASAEETFKLLPLSLLALRVTKLETPAELQKKRVKGQWMVKIEQHQDIKDELHYVWFYEGPQWKTKLYAGLALVAIMAVVMFPLWPMVLRRGVWYLSMGMLGLIGLFFAMAIFRLILFCVTVFVVPPGLWLYPNLFEDVGFFDSFRPVWGWQEDAKKKKKSSKAKSNKKEGATNQPSDKPSAQTSSATTGAAPSADSQQRYIQPRVEEVEE
ncbi:translocation protein [Xylona heveae TC161]|uniref:Translocation protein SEC62 n=1 Tax=Xylona heveae (strain CBS 132557 / TC161) TaxID=1328760 RepID=A0A161TCD8_XYLHT|nr:translocation protein [Xylona heveae TC161]KZF23437.1 translocation protein [Xylona heveae TC161]